MNTFFRGISRSAVTLGAPALLLLAMIAQPASAHHLMGFLHLEPSPLGGVLSGLLHPILGPDHLLFLLAIGLVGISQPLLWVPALLASGLIGSGVGLVLPGLPMVEPLVALSVATTGLVLARRLPSLLLVPAFAVHGYALSGSVIGWEPTPIAFYLLGLLISQSLLLTLSLTVVRRWGQRASSSSLALVSGLLIGVGMAFSWSALIP